MHHQQLNIGLFGLGVVGSGLLEVLKNSPLAGIQIKKIGVKTPGKPRPVPPEMLHYNPLDILDDPDINVVIETINGSDEAFDIVSEAMRRGKHVITSNKKMLAEHFQELIDLQSHTGVTLLYESAACAAIPIIKTLETHFANEPVDRISGIFNGTSNFILSKMTREKLEFDAALAQAQALGFAEQDPSSDIDAWDAAYKLVLLAAHSHGILVHPGSVLRFGIRHIRAEDIQFAQSKGGKIKLFPVCSRNGASIRYLYVLPALVLPSDPLFHVEDEYNGVNLEPLYSGLQFFSGRGAGSLPTGAAIAGDLAVLQRGFQYKYTKHHLNGHSHLGSDLDICVYVRGDKNLDFDHFLFKNILEKGENYRVGVLSAAWLQANQGWLNERQVFIMRYAF